jgi:hypothetical protein
MVWPMQIAVRVWHTKSSRFEDGGLWWSERLAVALRQRSCFTGAERGSC